MKKLLNTKQASKVTGYNEDYIRRLVGKGKLKAVQIGPKSQLRFLEVDLLNLTNAPQSYPMVKDIKKRPGKK